MSFLREVWTFPEGLHKAQSLVRKERWA